MISLLKDYNVDEILQELLIFERYHEVFYTVEIQLSKHFHSRIEDMSNRIKQIEENEKTDIKIRPIRFQFIKCTSELKGSCLNYSEQMKIIL
jgi:hypothetical protein